MTNIAILVKEENVNVEVYQKKHIPYELIDKAYYTDSITYRIDNNMPCLHAGDDDY